jgi:hypothetical protein
MHNRYWMLLIPALILGAIVLNVYPAAAGSQPQVVYQTPTARPDGRVVYIVTEGDTCLRIQLLTGVTIEQLRTLNRLDQECTLIPGKELLLTVITPQPSPTANPNVTNTPLLPTPTPFNGNGQVCVFLFNDINGNASHEETEETLAGGAISITDRLGQVSKTENTLAELEPVCVEIPEGDYNISMAIPTGYNATTELNLQDVQVNAGDQAILEFGAQVSTAPQEQPEAAPAAASKDTTSMLLALFGGLLILMGIGLGIYIAVGRRS